MRSRAAAAGASSGNSSWLRILLLPGSGRERIVKAMPDNRRVTGLDKWTLERLEEFLEDRESEAVPHADPETPFLSYDAVRAELARRRSAHP